ncbi:MAG: hypothetical protein Roseis2KO_22190 [Roseivirga sp.]
MSEQNSKTGYDDEFSLVKFLIPLWKKKWFIVMAAGIGIGLGILVYVLSEKQYSARSTFVPISGEGGTKPSLGRLGNLASLAGFSVNLSSGTEFPPTLFPELINNIENQLFLINAPLFYMPVNDTISFKEYYQKYYSKSIMSTVTSNTIGLPKKMLNKVKKKKRVDFNPEKFGIHRVKLEDQAAIARLVGQMRIAPDFENGSVSIVARMPDPLLAAQMVKHIEELIQREMTDYSINRFRNEYDYLKSNYERKKHEFDSVQNLLAKFRDENQDLTATFAINQIERLETEYNLRANLVLSLASQIQDTELSLTRNTPKFKIITPVLIPTNVASPNLMIYIFLGAFLMFTVAMAWIFVPAQLRLLKKQLSEED